MQYLAKTPTWIKYWGKTLSVDGVVSSDHPLVFHSLDVAAYARVYLERQPALLGQLAQWMGLRNDEAKSVLTFLLADSIEATLVRVEGDQLVAWARGRGEPDEDEWTLSAIRLPGWWLGDASRDTANKAVAADPALAARVEQIRARHRALKYRLILPLVMDRQGVWRCVLAGTPPPSFRYSNETGLDR